MAKVKNPIIYTHFGYPKGRGQETPTGTSQTVEGDAMTIEQIVRGNGLLQDERSVTYLDVPDLDKIDHLFRNDLDLTDLTDLKKRTEELQALVEKAEKRKKAMQEKDKSQKDLFDQDQEKLQVRQQRQQVLDKFIDDLMKASSNPKPKTE